MIACGTKDPYIRSTPIKVHFSGLNIKAKKYSILVTGEKLCNSLESMGPTFIKLGQFLATRPDIIGEEIAKKLEKLQDKLQVTIRVWKT